MLKIYYKGKMRRILSMQKGYADIKAWHDAEKKQIWPDLKAKGNSLRITLPEKGTEEWAYWVHVVDALRTIGASDDCYLYFETRGRRIYLIDSPDGSEPMQLEGNALYFAGDSTFWPDYIDETLTFYGAAPERCGGKRRSELWFRYATDMQYYQMNDGVEVKYDNMDENPPGWFGGLGSVFHSSWRNMLPIIPDTCFESITTKMQKEENVRFMFRVSGFSSGDVYCERMQAEIGGRGERYIKSSLAESSATGGSGRHVWVNNENVFNPGDTGFTLDLWSWSTMTKILSGVCVVFPVINRDFVLNVESVNEIAL